jgi:hypothetical protein
MPNRCCCLLTALLFLCQLLPAQQFRLAGRITNNKLEPLALVSIKLKNSPYGTLSKEDGSYELRLDEGSYDLVISMIGFKPQVINVVMNKDFTQNIILEPEEAKNLGEVIVKGKSKDRSEEVIRNVIRHKDDLMNAAGAWSCNVYIKATQEDSSARKGKGKRIKNAVADSMRRIDPNADLQRMAMAEISLHYDREDAARIKEERTGVVKRGNPESLFYLSLTEADFNLYNNLLRSRVLSEVPFLSPVSYSGLAAYKYKMLNIKKEGTRTYYTISIKPRQLSNVTVEGEITIMDSAWVILHSKFSLPTYHVAEYDFFEVEQDYGFVNDSAWMITRQQFRYYAKSNKAKVSGETIAAFRDFELNKTFPKKHFGTEVSSTTKAAYERDSSFWQQTRTEPLTPKEIRFIQYKDSIFRVTNSKAYLDSIDRKTNEVTWKKLLFFGQTKYNREKQRTWHFPTIPSLYQPFQFGGGRLQLGLYYSKIYKSRKTLSIRPSISYGFRNKDINGGIEINRLYNPFNRGYFHFYASRDFEYIFEGDAWINMIKRNNFYLDNSIGIDHELEVANGLYLHTGGELALRRSLAGYKTNDKVDSLFGNVLDDNRAVAFDPYNAVYGEIRLSYTPRQKYIREPLEKIILGSKWPTFYVLWRKGIPGIIKSKVDFDYLEFGIEQELKLGITGVSKYKILSGSFPNRRDLRLIDYKFQRKGDPILFMNPNEAFQSLDSTFPVFNRFYQGHYVHEFNGAIINKIPFLKKLNLREIAGAGFLIAPERNLRYVEVFAGIERVFKWPFDPLMKFKMGVYIIGSGSNQFRNPFQFKIGFTSWDKKRNKWI